MPRGVMVLADLFDLLQCVNTERKNQSQIKSYPRPWPDESKRISIARPSVSQEEVIAALRAAGHYAPLPGAAEE